MSAGFYKQTPEQMLYAAGFVEMQGIVLIASEKDQYQYPINGWIWAESEEEAKEKFYNLFLSQAGGVNDKPSPSFHVQPENFYLKTNKYDENEFTKLTTLTRLLLDAKQVSLTTPIYISDEGGNKHTVTIERFFQIMMSYGLFCYNLRNT